MNKKNDWLKSLKVGDTVIVESSGAYRGRMIDTIERLTKTQIITSVGKFRRNSGDEVGDYNTWTSKWIKEPTPEMINNIIYEKKRESAIRVIRHTEWKKIDLEKLVRIMKVLVDE